MNAAARIVVALEALHAGDTTYAIRVLEDLERELANPAGPSYRCPNCDLAFRWPGDLDHHLRFGCKMLYRRSAA